MKNQKGVTLVALSITVILFTIVLTTITFSSVSSIHLRRLNNMYEDILLLQGRVNNYYLQNNNPPTVDTTNEALNSFKSKMNAIKGTNFKSIKINPNDFTDAAMNTFADYKLLNMSADNGIKNPAYGGDFELNNNAATDYYAVNLRSLQVYYCKGVAASEDSNDLRYSIPFDKYVRVN